MLELYLKPEEERVFSVKENMNVCVLTNYSGEKKLEFNLDKNVHLNLSILCIGEKDEKNDLSVLINHQGEKSHSTIWSKIIGDKNSFQRVKIDVSMAGINSVSSNIQKQILLSEQSRSICEPVIITQGESIVANHGASSGFNILEELFFFQLRGIDKLQALKLLIEKEIHEINWSENFKEKIKAKTKNFDYPKILEVLS